MTRSNIADGTLVLWLGAATHLANRQSLGMAALQWRLMGARGLSAAFIVDASYNALLFVLYEAQRPSLLVSNVPGFSRRKPERSAGFVC